MFVDLESALKIRQFCRLWSLTPLSAAVQVNAWRGRTYLNEASQAEAAYELLKKSQQLIFANSTREVSCYPELRQIIPTQEHHQCIGNCSFFYEALIYRSRFLYYCEGIDEVNLFNFFTSDEVKQVRNLKGERNIVDLWDEAFALLPETREYFLNSDKKERR